MSHNRPARSQDIRPELGSSPPKAKFSWGRLFRRNRTENRTLETTESAAELDPLTASVNRAFNTGEVVVWTAGDPTPDPAGPIRRVPDELKRASADG